MNLCRSSIKKNLTIRRYTQTQKKIQYWLTLKAGCRKKKVYEARITLFV